MPLSFTVRANGSRRTVTDTTLFYGQNGFLSARTAASAASRRRTTVSPGSARPAPPSSAAGRSSVRAARDRVRFAPLPAGGRHRVVALVLGANGTPTGARMTGATFTRGRGRPAAPRRVRIARSGSTRVATRRVTRRG